MQGDQRKNLDILRDVHTEFPSKIPAALAVIRSEDDAAKRELVPLLSETVENANDRDTKLVAMLLLAKLAPFASEGRFNALVATADEFYSGVDAPMDEDDLFLTIAENASHEQRPLFVPTLTTAMETSQGVKRDAAFKALVAVATKEEDPDAREILKQTVLSHATGDEVTAAKEAFASRRKRK